MTESQVQAHRPFGSRLEETVKVVLGTVLVLCGGAVLLVNDRPVRHGHGTSFVLFDPFVLWAAVVFVLVGTLLVIAALLHKPR